MAASPSGPESIWPLLEAWSRGEPGALENLVPLVEPELRRLAHRYMLRERQGHTLQTTALVNEVYLRLADKTQPRWQDRAHFFAVAAQLMRRIMVDHARAHQALKRGGQAAKVSLDATDAATDARVDEILAVDEALARLARFDQRKARVVEMRHFGGMTVEEIAAVLDVHPNTVTREWSAAKAWLYALLHGENVNGP